jgi:outer membrane protein insertion porin family
MPKNKWIRLFFSSTLLLLLSCNVQKYIDQDQYLLKKQALQISKKHLTLNERNNLAYELEQYISPKPNTKSLGLFYGRLWAHLRLERDSLALQDSTANNWLEERLTEPPVYFRKEQLGRNLSNLTYVLYQKGFFEAQIKVDTLFNKGFAKVMYQIEPGKRYTIASLVYASEDSLLQNLMVKNKNNSLLKKGYPIDNQLFEQEKIRIQNLALNHGYYGFNTSYLPNMLGDSSDYKVNVTLRILNPEDKDYHPIYSIGEINIFTQNDPLTKNFTDYKRQYKEINFYGASEKFVVKPEVLEKQVYLKPGQLYSKNLENLTIRRLSTLGIYRYPTVRTMPSTTDSTKVDYNIYLTPAKDKDIITDISINRSNQTTSAPLLGLGAEFGFIHKNLLRGGENFGLLLDASVELLPRNLNEGLGIFNSAVYRAKNDFRFNKLLDINGLFYIIKKTSFGNKPLFSEKFKNLIQVEARSSLSTSFDYSFIVNAYTTRSLNINFSTNLSEESRRKSYTFVQTGFNLLVPEATEDFQNTFLSGNPLLAQSFFNNQLFTGLLFKSFTFSNRPAKSSFGEVRKSNFNLEASGLEVLLVERIVGKRIDPGFANFSRFLKAEYTTSYYKEVNGFLGAGLMASMGIASPISDPAGVPYVKKLQVGGPNSMRAWEYRQLGPGGTVDSLRTTGRRLNNYFQRGDLKLEVLSEIRFDMFWILKGAVFFDVGNIWSLDKNDRPEAQFKFSEFTSQLAIGSGFGIRMDFDFFVIRTDFGTKVRTPYFNESTTSHYPYRNFNEAFRDLQLNLALDYPF